MEIITKPHAATAYVLNFTFYIPFLTHRVRVFPDSSYNHPFTLFLCTAVNLCLFLKFLALQSVSMLDYISSVSNP